MYLELTWTFNEPRYLHVYILFCKGTWWIYSSDEISLYIVLHCAQAFHSRRIMFPRSELHKCNQTTRETCSFEVLTWARTSTLKDGSYHFKTKSTKQQAFAPCTPLPPLLTKILLQYIAPLMLSPVFLPPPIQRHRCRKRRDIIQWPKKIILKTSSGKQLSLENSLHKLLYTIKKTCF